MRQFPKRRRPSIATWLLVGVLFVAIVAAHRGRLPGTPLADPDVVAAQVRGLIQPKDLGITHLEVAPRLVDVGSAEALASVVAATRLAGVQMLTDADGENAIVSPSSLLMALSMLAEGAEGETLTELEHVIGAVGDERRDAVAALRGVSLSFDGDPALVQADQLPAKPMMHLATQVVVDDELILEPTYLELLAEVYGAGLQKTDLETTAGKRLLDNWVRYHSGGLIDQSSIMPGRDLRLVLQDAIVLAARWETPFAESGTSSQPFILSGGKQVSIPMMVRLTESAYAEVAGWQAVRLPYVGGELHADFIIPPIGTDPATATAELLGELDQALATAKQIQVELWVPKLDLQPEQPLNLLNSIAALGAPTVLTAAADLSGVGQDVYGQPLYLAQANQQAILQVDEEGTRAAAITEFGVLAGSMPPAPQHILRFDRPFAVVVAHTETSWPLFHAVVRNP